MTQDVQTEQNHKTFTPSFEQLTYEKTGKYNRKRPNKIVLPSRGYLYDGQLPNGEIVISAMTMREEKFFVERRKEKNKNIIRNILEACILEMPIPIEHMLLPDMFYTLLCIRNISYGTEYSCTFSCGKCGESLPKEFKLPNDLSILALTEDDDCEPYHVELPAEGDKVTFRIPRVRDEKRVQTFAEQRKITDRESLGDSSYIYRIAIQIESVNGETLETDELIDWAEDLIGEDSDTLQAEMKKRDFGPNLILRYECPECLNKQKMVIPFDDSFFRPKSSKLQ